MMTKQNVADVLMHTSRDVLYQIVYDAYKDQYNVHPCHMYNCTVAELASWYLSHYHWDEKNQCWESKIPFDNDDDSLYASQKDKYNYYRQFE